MATPFRSPRAAQPRRKEKGGLFKLLVGVHFGPGPAGCECDDCAKGVVVESRNAKGEIERKEVFGTNHTYQARPNGVPESEWTNDLIRSDQDLEARYNQGEYSRKFARVIEGVQQAAEPPSFPLERMKIAQLLAVAEAEGVDLKGATKKEDIISAIQQHDAARPVAG
jgi:hypothetical protein